MADRAYSNPSIVKHNIPVPKNTYGNPSNIEDFKNHLRGDKLNESENSDSRNSSIINPGLNSTNSSHNSSSNSFGGLTFRHNGHASPNQANSQNPSPILNRMPSPNTMTLPNKTNQAPNSMVTSHSMPSTYRPETHPASRSSSGTNLHAAHPAPMMAATSPASRFPGNAPTNNYTVRPQSKPIDHTAMQRFPYASSPVSPPRMVRQPLNPATTNRPNLSTAPTQSILPPGKPPPMMGIPFMPPMQASTLPTDSNRHPQAIPPPSFNPVMTSPLNQRLPQPGNLNPTLPPGQSIPAPRMNSPLISTNQSPPIQGQPMPAGPLMPTRSPSMTGPPMSNQGQPMPSQGQQMPGPPMPTQSPSMTGPPMSNQGQQMPGPPMSNQGQPKTAASTGPAHHSVTGRREYPTMNTLPAQGDVAAPPPSYGGAPQPTNTYTSFENMSLQAADTVRPLNLLEDRHVLPAGGITSPKANLPHDLKQFNCDPEIFRCSLNSVPNCQSLLQKSRLPFGILIQPFKDLEDINVIQTNTIVRCRSCRTYINPFVQFIDARRWKCNLCYRYNDLPDEFNYDPYTKVYQEPSNRPEIRNGTVEFIAPAEYTLRAPQPAVYLYCLDVSRAALDSGYLQIFCDTMLKNFDDIPGDNRSQIGFITYDETLQFYNLDSELSQPSMLVVSDLDEVLLPNPDCLLVNVKESIDLIKMLLESLVDTCNSCSTHGNGSAVGACLQAAYKLMSSTGGRIMFVNSQLVTLGPGALKCREDPNERASQKITNLGPACDYYKRLALDCSTQQIAVDLFMINSSYSDIATLGEISRHSSGCMYYFPSFDVEKNKLEVHRFRNTLKRYFTRKIGFESVMRIRCSRGLEIEAFHGNFFVRSTNLLALANINPDASFAAQLVIEDNIEASVVSMQAALLYTSSIGERRIRVHTICLPVTKVLSEVFSGADQQCIIGLVAKMGVKRSITASISDAREAFVNVAVDSLESYCNSVSAQKMGKLLCPVQLRMIPIYILALLKCGAMRIGTSTKLDSRVMSLQRLVTLPLKQLLRTVHPDLYPIHMLDAKDNGDVITPPLLQLSSANVDSNGAYLMDVGLYMYLWVGTNVSPSFCQEAFDKEDFNSMADCVLGIIKLNTKLNIRLHAFINQLNMDRAIEAPVIVMREGCASFHFIIEKLIEDRTQSTFSYYEFLQHIQSEIKCT